MSSNDTIQDMVTGGDQANKNLDPRKANFRSIKVRADTFNKITNPVFEKHQVDWLQRKTPASQIYERPAKGGGTWYYVTAAYVIKSLNVLFGFDWDFEIKSFDIKGTQCLLHGRLTGRLKDENGNLKATISRESFGRADIKLNKADRKPMDLGNDLKAAESDCLKRCYRQLGGALDVFATSEFAEIILVDEEGKELGDLKDKALDKVKEEAAKELLNQRETEAKNDR